MLFLVLAAVGVYFMVKPEDTKAAPPTTTSAAPTTAERTTRTRAPDGREVRMQPLAVDMPGALRNMSFPPKYGEHTQSVLAEAGYSIAECTSLAEQGIIA